MITWPVETGDWTLLVMNADGSRNVAADVAIGATVPAARWVVAALVGAGALLMILSAGLFYAGLHRRSEIPLTCPGLRSVPRPRARWCCSDLLEQAAELLGKEAREHVSLGHEAWIHDHRDEEPPTVGEHVEADADVAGVTATGTSVRISWPANRTGVSGPRTLVTKVWTKRWWSMKGWKILSLASPRNTTPSGAPELPRGCSLLVPGHVGDPSKTGVPIGNRRNGQGRDARLVSELVGDGRASRGDGDRHHQFHGVLTAVAQYGGQASGDRCEDQVVDGAVPTMRTRHDVDQRDVDGREPTIGPCRPVQRRTCGKGQWRRSEDVESRQAPQWARA